MKPKNAHLKISMDSELKENLTSLSETIGITRSQLIRSFLWESSIRILSDLRSKKGKKPFYILTIKQGREFLTKEEVKK